MLERVASRHAVRPRQPPPRLRADFARPEVEGRSNRLVQDPRQEHVRPCVEHLRFAIRAEDAVLVESIAAPRRRRRKTHAGIGDDDVARPQAGTREQVNRSVLAPQVVPADLEGAARRELEVLLRLAAWPGRPQPRAALDASAVRDGGRRRFLDLNEHVAPGLRFVLQLGDTDAAKQTERAQALLALDARRIAEWLARLQRELTLDRRRAGTAVADDDHVVDDDLRPFGDPKENVRSGVAIGEHDAGLDDDVLVAPVAIFEIDAVAVRGHFDFGVRAARHDSQHRPKLIVAEHHVAGDVHRTDEGAGAFGDVDTDLNPAVLIRPGTRPAWQHRHPGHDHRTSEATTPVRGPDFSDGAVERRLYEQVTAFQPHDWREVGRRYRRVPRDGHAVNEITRTASDREADRQFPRHLIAYIRRHRIAIPALVQVILDGAARILEQILVGGSFRADRHEAVAIGDGQLVAGKGDRDVRAAIDRDADNRPVSRKVHALGRVRLVKSPFAQRRLVFLQLLEDRGGVVRLPYAETRVGECRAIVGLGIQLDALNQGPHTRINVEHHRRAVRIVRELDARRDPRLQVAAVPVDELQRPGHIRRARRNRRGAEALGHRASEVAFGHAEHAAKLHPIDGVDRKQHVAKAHPVASGLLVDLHVLIARQAREVRDRLAHVGDRQRRADFRLDQAED